MTTTADILSHPPPRLAPAALAAHLARHWGLTGDLTPLTAERDLNHRLDAPQARFTVKLANPAEPPALTAFQTEALLHAAATDPTLPIPHLRRTLTGAPWVDLPEGRLRVLTWLDGRPAALSGRSSAQARAIGTVLGRLQAALATCPLPPEAPVIQWDIQRVPDLARMLPGLPDPTFRAQAQAFISDFQTRITPALAALPAQVCHNDFNPHNLLTDQADPTRITGVIDFGDLVVTPRICDLAVACAYQMDPTAPLDGPCALVAGYAQSQSLSAQELTLLPDLIAARMVTSLVISTWRAARYPDNAEYILRNAPNATAGLQALQDLPPGHLAQALAEAAERTT